MLTEKAERRPHEWLMRAKDAEDSIYDDLRALGWRPYLVAMWLFCDELRSLYADQFSGEDRSLVESTLDLVRQAATDRDLADVKKQAGKLARAWRRLIRKKQDEDIPFGLMDTWATFDALAQEIAGTSEEYYGSEFVISPAILRWREPEHPGLLHVNADLRVDDASPMTQTLTKFAGIVRKVSEAQGPEWDPVSLLNE